VFSDGATVQNLQDANLMPYKRQRLAPAKSFLEQSEVDLRSQDDLFSTEAIEMMDHDYSKFASAQLINSPQSLSSENFAS